MKKYISYIKLFCLSAVTFTSCSDDIAKYEDLTNGNNFSSFQWYTSDTDRNAFNNASKKININSYVGFFDLSQGIVSREWVIPESAVFLNNKFSENDSIYEPFIDDEVNKTSDRELANVLFTGKGVQEVVLNTILENEVEGAEKVDKGWLVKQVFDVDVFANIEPAGEVARQNFTSEGEVDEANPYSPVLTVTEEDNPTLEEQASWAKITIEAGEKLRFVNSTTIGRPTGVRWFTTGGKPEVSNAQSVEITYNKLGSYTASMESFRANVPETETDNGVRPSARVEKLLPLNIEVIKSTRPFELVGDILLNQSQQKIQIAVTGEVESFLNQESNFNVNIKNEAKSFDQNVSVSLISLNSDDASIIELTLSEPFYSDDELKISYNNPSADSNEGVKSIDERILNNFEDILAVEPPTGVNALNEAWANFDNGNTNNRSAKAVGFWVGPKNDNFPNLGFSRDESKSFSEPASMKYTSINGITDGITLQGTELVQNLPNEANTIVEGTYEISYMVYIEATSSITTFRNVEGKTSGTFSEVVWDLSSVEKGKWVKVVNKVVFNKDAVYTNSKTQNTRIDIAIPPADNPGLTGVQTIYFDNMSLVKIEARP